MTSEGQWVKVQLLQAAFVKLLAADATPEPAIALGGALRPLGNG
jgi:hypothetical protein